MKSKIILNSHQLVEFARGYNEWLKIGLSTKHCDRDAAETAINSQYVAVKLPKPEKIIWCESPLTTIIAKEMLNDKSIWDLMNRRAFDAVYQLMQQYAYRDILPVRSRFEIYDIHEEITEQLLSRHQPIKQPINRSMLKSIGLKVGNSDFNSNFDCIFDVNKSDGCTLADNRYLEAAKREYTDIQYTIRYRVIYAEYLRAIYGLREETEAYALLASIAKHVGGILFCRRTCFVCERPRILKLNGGRLHSLSGPAVAYSDGCRLYYYRGTRVPEYVIDKKITVKRIEGQTNSEIQQIMIDIYGQEQYIQDSGAEIISKDDCGELYGRLVRGQEPIIMVKVINSTPESDGSSKSYWLRVHPQCRPLLGRIKMGEPQPLTPRNAVASTFGLYGEQYQPKRQT